MKKIFSTLEEIPAYIRRKLVNEKELFNKKRGSCRIRHITNQLKHQSSDRYKGKKPPRKKFGGTTLYGPVAAQKIGLILI